MRTRHLAIAIGVAMSAVVLTSPARAQTFNSGSTGVDGAVNLAINSGTTTLTVPPSGVFNFTTVTIRFGSTLKFARNATNTPVTILASSNVTIDQGTIDVSGAPGSAGLLSNITVAGNGGAGGPGGFDGGTGAIAGATVSAGSGRGPGGGTGGTNVNAGGGGGGFFNAGTNGTNGAGSAGQGGAAYSDQTLLPLIGGSGGGGGGAVYGNTGGGGGGGGGAILIASSGTINMISGTIKVTGGAAGGGAGSGGGNGTGAGGAGSGGAIRLVATAITGTGVINISPGQQQSSSSSTGGAAGAGRVRIEGFTNTFTGSFPGSTAGTVSSGSPTSVALANGPTLAITAIGGVTAPASPSGSFSTPDVVLSVTTTNPVTINLAAANIPVGTIISLSVIGQTGGYSATVSSPLAGSSISATATASVTAPTTQPFVISASATYAVAALEGQGPIYADGEPVERMRVTAATGGRQHVSYITRSGREVPVAAR